MSKTSAAMGQQRKIEYQTEAILDDSQIVPTRFMTPKEFMKEKNLPRNTVYEGVRDGSIPSIRISRRKILIPEDALERRLAQAYRVDEVG